MKYSATDLYRIITSGEIDALSIDCKLWGGADVIITDQVTDEVFRWAEERHLVIGFQHQESMRHIVVSPYAKQISWLFEAIRDSQLNSSDYASKYDFYAHMAKAANDSIKSGLNKTEVLLAVLYAAKL